MNLITEQDAKQAAEQGLIPAIKCSILHHEQGRDMELVDLLVAIKEGKFGTSDEYCALCKWEKQNRNKCPLKLDCGGYCIGEWFAIVDSLTLFQLDPSNANHTAFLKAESKMVARLEAELAKALVAEIEEFKAKVEAEKKAKEKEVKTQCTACKFNSGDKTPCQYCNDNCSRFEPEEKKPELRHGDYGHHPEYGNAVFINPARCDNKGEFELEDGGYCSIDIRRDFVIFGNIFDDLKAQGEDLEEFEVKSTSSLIRFVQDQGVFIDMVVPEDNVGTFSFPIDSVEEIGHKLIRMARTARKKQNKK